MVYGFCLRSYNDASDRDGTGSGWYYSLETVTKIDESDSSAIDALAMTGMTSADCICGDFSGPVRKITIEGERADNTVDTAGATMTNAVWVANIRGLLSKFQILKGPYKFIKTTNPTSLFPNETVYVMIEDFRVNWDKETPTNISYSLKMVVSKAV